MVNNELLHRAAEWNDVVTARILLAWGVDSNGKDESGRTPLHRLALKNNWDSHYDLAELLLVNGANPSLIDKAGFTPLEYLMKNGDVNTVLLFMNFCRIYIWNNVEVHSLLPPVNHGDLPVCVYDGRYLLKSAVNSNNPLLFSWMLDLLPACAVNLPDAHQQTPLHIAMAFNYGGSHSQHIRLLLEHGADLNAMDTRGLVPINYLFKSNELRTLEPFFFNFAHAAADVVPRFTGEVITKEDFQLLLAHADFDKIIVNGADSLRRLHEKFGTWLIEHLAKIDIMDETKHTILANVINSRNEYKVYFENCRSEIKLAKVSMIANADISFYKLLVGDVAQATDDDLISVYSNRDWIWNFSIYGTVILENVKKEVDRRELIKD